MAQTQIKITTNAADVNRWLMGKQKKVWQAAKAALSKTTMQVQHAERIELNREFTVRKAAFMRNRIKIFKFPKATEGGDMVAVIGIDDKVRGTPLLLSQFEAGGKKRPVQGSRVAIPITGGKARPSFKRSVPPSMRLQNLGLKPNKGGIPVGNRRTFILPTKRGEYAVFQRGGAMGTGKDKGMSPLYIFRNTVPLKKRMHFVRIAKSLAEEQLPKLFNRYLRLYIND